MKVDYVIVTVPKWVRFKCPHCCEEIEILFEDVDYKTAFWHDGAWVNCPKCGKEVELDNYEYD